MSKKTNNPYEHQKEIHKQVEKIIQNQEKTISVDSGRVSQRTEVKTSTSNHTTLKKNLI